MKTFVYLSTIVKSKVPRLFNLCFSSSVPPILYNCSSSASATTPPPPPPAAPSPPSSTYAGPTIFSNFSFDN